MDLETVVIGGARSTRPLGMGAERGVKLGAGLLERGAGEEKVGRESERGAGRLGMEGGLLLSVLPRKVEGRETRAA